MLSDGSSSHAEVSALLSHDSYPTRIYEVLKRRISDGEIVLGTKLAEAHLVKEFGVSRTPIREALNRLAQEGLVTIKPFRGAFVVSLSEAEVRELFEIREALEGMAARMAAMHMPKQDLVELGARLKKGLAVIRRDVYAKYSRADRDFHEAISQASGNRELAQLLKTLAGRIQIIRGQTVRLPSRAHKSFQEHMEVIEAIARRDSELAEIRMRAHIRVVKEDFLRALARGDSVPVDKNRANH